MVGVGVGAVATLYLIGISLEEWREVNFNVRDDRATIGFSVLVQNDSAL